MNWMLLINSLIVSLGATALSLAIGFCASLWVQGLSNRWRTRAIYAAVVTLALPPFVITNCWMELLGNTGILRGWLPLSIYSVWGTIWILGLLNWPVSFLFISAALTRIEASHWESDAELRGWNLIRWVLWPEVRPVAKLAALLSFVFALNNFTVPALLQTKVFAAELWVSFNTTFNYREAVLLSLPLIAAPILLLRVFASGKEIAWPVYGSDRSFRLFRRQMGNGWFGFCGAVALTTVALALGLPLGLLMGESQTWTELWPAFAAGKSALANSFFFAAGASTGCVTLGVLCWRFRLSRLLWLPFLVPGVLLGIAMVRILNQPFLTALYQSYWIVLIAFTLRFLAVSLNGAQRAMQSLDPELTSDAKLCGASGWRLFWNVQAPQIGPALAAVWYITYVLCLWDIETLILIIPPGAETVSLRIFNLLHYGHNSHVNALCLLLLALAALPLVLSQLGKAFANRPSLSSLIVSSWLKPAIATMTLGVLAGCGGAPTLNGARLESELFGSVEIIGSRGTGVGQFNKPRSLAIDQFDNLYVVDMTGRVQKFSSDGVFLASVQMPETDLGRPKGMCRDALGNIIVIEPHYSRINHLSTSLQTLSQWGTKGTNIGQFTLPRAAAVDSSGAIYISEYSQAERVQKFAKDGMQLILAIGMRGADFGEFNRPEGLAVDSEDRLYVADSCNHRIQVFKSDGSFLRAYGRPGTGAGEFSYPYDIRVDPSGVQFVCEFGNSRIQVFDQSDRLVEVLGKAGSAPGEFNNPWAIALDSYGNLYVADSRNHRVQKLIRRIAHRDKSS